MVLIQSLTNPGNFVGPLIFKSQDAPRYIPGFIGTTVTAIVAGILAVVYRILGAGENKRRDRTGAEAFDHAYEDDLTDMKVCLQSWTSFESIRLIFYVESAVQIPIVKRSVRHVPKLSELRFSVFRVKFLDS